MSPLTARRIGAALVVAATLQAAGPVPLPPWSVTRALAATEPGKIYLVGELRITGTRALIGPSGTAAAFFTVDNRGGSDDRLMGATFAVADQSVIVSQKPDATIDTGRGLEIPAGGTLDLGPGSYEVALQGLHTPLKQGDEIQGVLHFERAGPLEAVFVVAGLGNGSDAQPAP